jgi:glyoxylase-like metal-dependent hydrolase (beta-lactamase superfamily II)
MLFRQLFEPESSTYTYLLSCPDTGVTALIDPVLETVERDLALLQQLGLKLDYTIDTHVHADHLTGALRLRELCDSRIVYPAMVEAICVDIGLREGEAFRIGNLALQPLFTPGHTDHHHAYLIDNGTQKMLFSGDALLIDACGRTDFQSGDARSLYHSIHDKFFTLPDETLVYPCHDYEGRFVSTIAQEKSRNPRLGQNRSLEEFVQMMEEMDLPYPRKIDVAVPGNEACGVNPRSAGEAEYTVLSKHDQG